METGNFNAADEDAEFGRIGSPSRSLVDVLRRDQFADRREENEVDAVPEDLLFLELARTR